jgi:N-acetylmuramoyl-L-alanine amidase
MEIKYHKLSGGNVDFIQSPNGGDVITPSFLVMHYTAGYNGKSAIDTFLRRDSKVSAHLVLDRDGKVTQMMPFNKKAWHAGPSKFQGVEMLNGHAIGFEFVNIGWLKKSANGFVDPYGSAISASKFEDYVIGKNARVGHDDLYWPVYTQAQIDAGLEIATLLIAQYPIKGICTHEEIDTRGWKVDPGPAFPLKSFKNLLGAQRDDSATADETATVNAGSLNVRGGPGTNFGVITGLKKGDSVKVVGASGDWSRIEAGSTEGWALTTYLTK